MSEELIEVTDAKGRKFKLRELDPSDALDVLEAAGEQAKNIAWVQYATAVCSVVEIDGIPVPMPRSKEAIKGLARKVGNPGIVAVTRALYGEITKKVDEKADEEAETAKN